MPERKKKKDKKTQWEWTTPCTWARWMKRHSFVVWDTETTGLEDYAKICSIGIVAHTGEVLLDTLINPLVHIPEDATDIHGITDEMVKDSPTFAEVYSAIRKALMGQRWVTYNADYDTARLEYECWRHGLLYPTPMQYWRKTGYMRGYSQQWLSSEAVYCAMNQYANHWGQWHEYYQSYTWQSLSNAAHQQNIKVNQAHHALSDALTCLELVNRLAISEDRKEGAIDG